MRAFISHLLNENDINNFEIIETRHFDTSNYISNRSKLINKLLLFLFISLRDGSLEKLWGAGELQKKFIQRKIK